MAPQAWDVGHLETSLRSYDCHDCPDGVPGPGFHEACSSVLRDSALQFFLDDVDFNEPPPRVRKRLAYTHSAGLSKLMPDHAPALQAAAVPSLPLPCAGERVTAAVLYLCAA